MTNPVVTHQPGPVAYGTNVQTGEWSTGLCSCCSDIMVCALGCLCPIALGCYTANKYGENVCLACIPGGMTAMRTHMRLTYGIQVWDNGDLITPTQNKSGSCSSRQSSTKVDQISSGEYVAFLCRKERRFCPCSCVRLEGSVLLERRCFLCRLRRSEVSACLAECCTSFRLLHANSF
uniref:Uncharacterized protein n=1 Tax=Scleropages formosus TaxID=113540 RepID=A0A8C9RB02_SCLFO